jgi:hypothetical protein
VKRGDDLPAEERERTQQFLKVFANSGSYGVFVEMIRKQTRADKPADLAVYGRDGRFSCRTTAPEDPAAFYFPPIGAVITAAARLMLALLERCVTDSGGSYAFADTDSMAIVASESGGLILSEGGPNRFPDETPAIRALSWETVDSIVDRFKALNPYDPKAVPGSILKIEDVNFDPKTGKQRQIHAFAISAKRYALFTIESDRRPEILEAKEHGLGQYLNPIDPEREDRDWIRETWEGLVGEVLGGPTFQPSWGDAPAMIRASIPTPLLLDRFAELNRKKAFADRLKPFNFLLSATVDSFDRPAGVGDLRLIAPYSRNPTDWLDSLWIDIHSGTKYRIRTTGETSESTVRVQTFADVIDRFRMHPEAKSACLDGSPSIRRAIGLLGRLHVHAFNVSHIGKETNLLEQQEEGIIPIDPQAVYLGEGDWEILRSLLDRVSIPELAAQSEVSERMLRSLRKGDRRASAKTLQKITAALAQLLDKGEG